MTTPAGRKASSPQILQTPQTPQASQAEAMRAKRLALASKASSSSEAPQTGSATRGDAKPKTGWRKIFNRKPVLTTREEAIEKVLTLAEMAVKSPDFLKSEGIFRKSANGTEKAEALKNPEKYFKENKDTKEPRKYYAVATAIKENLKIALANKEKITLALISGIDPDELKAHINPDFKGMVDVLHRLILSDQYSVEVPVLFRTLAELCHNVAKYETVNLMGLSQLTTCIAPNLMPPMNSDPTSVRTTEDVKKRTEFVEKLNGLVADMMELWMTGKEPASTAEAESKVEPTTVTYSAVKIREASRPLHRRFSQAMQYNAHDQNNEQDIVYVEGLAWHSIAATSTSSIYSTFAGVDVDYDSVGSASEKDSDEEDVHTSMNELRNLQRQEEAMVVASGNLARERRGRRHHSEASSDSASSSSSSTDMPPPVFRHDKPRAAGGKGAAPVAARRHLKLQATEEESAPPTVPRHLKPKEVSPPVPARGVSLEPRITASADPLLSEIKQVVKKRR